MEPIVLARAATERPRVSVAVSTRNRRHLLPRLVQRLEEQTMDHGEFEVVIVDDASTDGTADELRALANRSSVPITAARLSVRSGPAVGRNVAWRLARGEVIAFTDDDCQPTPGWLEASMEKIRAGSEVVVGRVIPDPEQHDLLGPFSRTLHIRDARHLATCNIAYRRADLVEVGGFDESFPSWAAGGEDTDLGWRVRGRLGKRVDFAPEALVYHDVRPSSFPAKVKETMRWRGIPRLVALHPEEGRRMLYRRLFWKPTHPKALLALVGLLLAGRFPPAALLALPWIRYRTRFASAPGSAARRAGALPGLLVIDLLEVAVMVRGSIEQRTLVL